MFDTVCFILPYYISREEDTEQGNQIMTATKNCLLKGLSDEDARNRWERKRSLSIDDVKMWSQMTRSS